MKAKNQSNGVDSGMTPEEYREDIIAKMKEVNTYNDSFEHIIKVLAKTLADYEVANENFKKTGGHIIIKHTNKTGATNLVKNPIYLAIEKMRDDILSYSRELGLTPAGLARLNDELKTNTKGKKSRLSKVLQEMEREK